MMLKAMGFVFCHDGVVLTLSFSERTENTMIKIRMNQSEPVQGKGLKCCFFPRAKLYFRKNDLTL